MIDEGGHTCQTGPGLCGGRCDINNPLIHLFGYLPISEWFQWVVLPALRSRGRLDGSRLCWTSPVDSSVSSVMEVSDTLGHSDYTFGPKFGVEAVTQ